MSTNNTNNVPRYAGYFVKKLPKKPKIATYLCNGKLQKWVPDKWIAIEEEGEYFFDDIKTGKCHHFNKPKPCEEKCENIVRLINVGCEKVIAVKIIGECPVISKYSEICPISIECNEFIIDLTCIPCGSSCTLSYTSNCGKLSVNVIFQRPCSPIIPCPTLF